MAPTSPQAARASKGAQLFTPGGSVDPPTALSLQPACFARHKWLNYGKINGGYAFANSFCTDPRTWPTQSSDA